MRSVNSESVDRQSTTLVSVPGGSGQFLRAKLARFDTGNGQPALAAAFLSFDVISDGAPLLS